MQSDRIQLRLYIFFGFPFLFAPVVACWVCYELAQAAPGSEREWEMALEQREITFSSSLRSLGRCIASSYRCVGAADSIAAKLEFRRNRRNAESQCRVAESESVHFSVDYSCGARSALSYDDAHEDDV